MVALEYDEFLVGTAPGTALANDVIDPAEQFDPTHEEVFTVEGLVSKMDFAPGWKTNDIWTGTGSGRVTVHEPSGRQVYTSQAFNCAGLPEADTACAAELSEAQNGPFPAGEYTAKFYVAGAMGASLKVTVTTLIDEA